PRAGRDAGAGGGAGRAAGRRRSDRAAGGARGGGWRRARALGAAARLQPLRGGAVRDAGRAADHPPRRAVRQRHLRGGIAAGRPPRARAARPRPRPRLPAVRMSDPLPWRSERVVVRRLRAADLERFQAYRHDPEVGRYQGWEPQADAEALAFLEEMAVEPFGRVGEW